METLLIALTLLSACLPPPATSTPISAQPSLQVFVTRHAEKASDGSADPPLTTHGHEQAAALAAHLEPIALVAVYSTPYQRTLQTCAPAAESQGLQIDTALQPVEGIADHLQATNPGGPVLVCGHSNTVPALLQALGAEDSLSIADDEYGEVWLLLQDDAGVQVKQQRYAD